MLGTASDESRGLLSGAESEASSLLQSARAEAKGVLGEANAKADALNSAASDKVAEVSSVNSAAQKEKAGLERGIANIESEIAETQATLDKTFFLNFGKKGARDEPQPRP